MTTRRIRPWGIIALCVVYLAGVAMTLAGDFRIHGPNLAADVVVAIVCTAVGVATIAVQVRELRGGGDVAS